MPTGAVAGGVTAHLSSKSLEKKIGALLQMLKDGNLEASTLASVTNELASLGVENPEELMGELMKIYTRADIGTQMGADGFPNSIKLGDLIDMNQISISNDWQPMETRPGMSERIFKLYGGKFRVQLTTNPNLSVAEVRDVPGRMVLHLSSNVFTDTPTDLMTVVFPSYQSLNSFRHFTYWGYPLDFVGPFQNQLR